MSQPESKFPTAHPIPVIGIVGGVGSGKSAVAKKLAELVPCAVIDADRAGHQALELPEVREQLRARFGEEIFDGQGSVVRAKLAAKVFGEAPAAVATRTELEQIVHPAIARLVEEQIDRHQAARDVRWILLDAAVMLEAKWRTQTDAVVFVNVNEETRWQRVEQRGWSREEWKRREASQWPVERKRAAADIVIDNNGSLLETARALQNALRNRFPTND